MNKYHPLVSIIAPCYNHQRFIRESLNSVLQQTYSNIELIVIDDGSTDNSVSIIEDVLGQISSSKKSILKKTSNQGAHNAINLGLSLATGDFIGIINTDDLFTLSRVENLLEPLLQGRTQFSFSKVSFIDQESKPFFSNYTKHIDNIQNLTDGVPTVGFASLVGNVSVSTGNFLFSRKLLEKIGKFKSYRYCHDWDFLLRALAVTEPVQISTPEYKYRLHGHNSFLKLQDVATGEVNDVLTSFFTNRQEIENYLYPCARFWPYYYEDFVRKNPVLQKIFKKIPCHSRRKIWDY